MAKVYVGIGHGGSDPGACANNLRESDLTLKIGKKLFNELIRHGVKCAISRTDDTTDALNDKIKRCNQFAPDLAVDVHINAGGGKGFEAIVYSKGGTSLTLGQNIEKEVLKIGQNSRGMKTKLDAAGKDYFGWIRQVNAPSVILEAGFIDNTADVALFTSEGLDKFAIAYAKGILATLNIAYKSDGATTASTTANATAAKKDRYNSLSEIPVGEFRDTVKSLMDKKIINVADGKLDLSHDMIRLIVMNNRAKLYG